ncbi:unnamed protein product [Peniophora sp. CBMAI 1063]|nr:unnamed protein product [Peniophora sp. CBMAI 1063]
MPSSPRHGILIERYSLWPAQLSASKTLGCEKDIDASRLHARNVIPRTSRAFPAGNVLKDPSGHEGYRIHMIETSGWPRKVYCTRPRR